MLPHKLRLPSGPPPVFRSRNRIFLSPSVDQISVQNILNHSRMENMEGYLPGTSTQFHRSCSGARQAAILEPSMPLSGRNGQNVLDLARDDRQAFDAYECLGNDR